MSFEMFTIIHRDVGVFQVWAADATAARRTAAVHILCKMGVL